MVSDTLVADLSLSSLFKGLKVSVIYSGYRANVIIFA